MQVGFVSFTTSFEKLIKVTGTHSRSTLFLKCIVGSMINYGLCIVKFLLTRISYTHSV